MNKNLLVLVCLFYLCSFFSAQAISVNYTNVEGQTKGGEFIFVLLNLNIKNKILRCMELLWLSVPLLQLVLRLSNIHFHCLYLFSCSCMSSAMSRNLWSMEWIIRLPIHQLCHKYIVIKFSQYYLD